MPKSAIRRCITSRPAMGPLIVLLHGFPESGRLAAQIAPLAAAGFRASPPTRVATTFHRSQRTSRPTPSTCSPPTSAPHRRTRCGVRAVGRSRLGRNHRLDHRDESPRGGRPTRHPQRGPPRRSRRDCATRASSEVLVLLLLCATGIPRSGARQRLALLPTLPGGREPALHATRKSNATSRRGRGQGQRPG